MTYSPDPTLVEIVEQADQQLRDRLAESFGSAAPPLGWLDRRFGGHSLAHVFLDVGAYPLLPLPWWAAPDADTQTHLDLAYSSICGYLFIRVIDDVTDGDHVVPVELLPALGFFHTEFTACYRRWFGPDHEFWRCFERHWYETAGSAMADLGHDVVGRAQFEQAAARKTTAAVIPLAAVLHRQCRAADLDVWAEFIGAFGRWHQFQNDIEGIVKDDQSGAVTWAISEARAAAGDLSPRAWLWTAGLEWAAQQLASYAADTESAAAELSCRQLDQYVAFRVGEWQDRFGEVGQQLDSILSL